jgi:hypothetical protein
MKPNLSKLTRKLEKPAPPTVAQLLGADKDPPLSTERRTGYAAAALLASRDAARWEAAHAQREAAAVAKREADDLLWAKIQARNAQAVG